MIYSGPHFFVSNPLYKTPREIDVLKKLIMILLTTPKSNEDFIARTNYIPHLNPEKFNSLNSNQVLKQVKKTSMEMRI
jgi:hypothetical protein